jgi:hypothetical protein
MELRTLTLPPNARLFSMDAVSMYTNIDTGHALTVIAQWLEDHPCDGVDTAALLHGLRIVMRHNIFRFGDTYWVQMSGTAMGAPPAPHYATLYYAIHEYHMVAEHPNVFYYGRFIDDVFGIWVPDTNIDDDNLAWNLFQNAVSFGSLRWEFTSRNTSLDFMDLNVTIVDNHLVTTLIEKALNLYLFLPPHSCHSKSMLHGIISGLILRIKRLTSVEETILPTIRSFYDRLLARSYNAAYIKPIFEKAYAQPIINDYHPKDQTNTDVVATSDNSLYLHAYYHQRNPTSQRIQHMYRNDVINTVASFPVTAIRRYRDDGSWTTMPEYRLTIAYHRYPNIGNLLSARKVRSTGVSVSALCDDIRHAP